MGIPFTMIFSILLIIVFIVVAFIAIRHFMGIKKCAEIGIFTDNLKTRIDGVWKAEAANDIFSESLSSGIKYVCFVNFSMPKKGEFLNLYDDLKYTSNIDSNFIFYPMGAACDPADKKISHLNMGEILKYKNPNCFKAEGKVDLTIKKSLDDVLVTIE